MNVEEEIVRLFKDKEPSKLEVSPKLLFNTKCSSNDFNLAYT